MKMLPMAYTVVGESRAHAEEREQVFLNDLVDPKASLTLLSELMNHDFSDMALEDPITDELIESVSGIRGLVQNLRKHIGGDTSTLADLAGHRATLLQGPRFVGTGPEVADQMQEWFDGDACDGFVIAATHVPGAYEDVVRLVVPELQRRGVFRDRYTGATLREHLGLRPPRGRGAVSAPLRVVQWATGNIGTRSLRAVIEHPGLELVGLHVHTEDKVGRDAGDLAGTDPTGVLATGSIEDVLALGADCVLYMPQGCDLDAVCRLLASGANIVTTRGEFLRPASMDPDERRRVEDACAAGGTSIHSTGSSPGFISEALPIVLLTMQRRLDRLLIDEFADMSSRELPGDALRPDGLRPRPGRLRRPSLRPPRPRLRPVAVGAGRRHRSAPRRHRVRRRGRRGRPRRRDRRGPVAAGTVAAQRPVVTGLRDGEPLLEFRANWYVTTDVEPAWDLRETGWRVQVLGDTPLDLEIRFPVEPERYAQVSPGFTAHPAVNAVATVCAAAPGIRTTFDLPRVLPDLR